MPAAPPDRAASPAHCNNAIITLSRPPNHAAKIEIASNLLIDNARAYLIVVQIWQFGLRASGETGP